MSKLLDILMRAERALNFAASQLEFQEQNFWEEGDSPSDSQMGIRRGGPKNRGQFQPGGGSGGMSGAEGGGSGLGEHSRKMGDAPGGGGTSPGVKPDPLHNPNLEISTRNPTLKSRTENPLTSRLTIGVAAMRANPERFRETTNIIKQFPNVRVPPKASPDVIAQTFVQQCKDNILWLWDQVSDELKVRSQLWYEGGNKIAHEMAKTYGVPVQATAGVIAALSPQQDWYVNMDLAHRIFEGMKNQDNIQWDNFFTVQATRIMDQRNKQADKDEMREIIQRCSGKKMSEMTDPLDKAAFIMLNDLVYGDPSYRIVSPEGEFLEKATTKSGELGGRRWGGLDLVANAVNIIQKPTVENISESLGQKHKVRNFYNNIISPNSKHGDVTIDTHAVAAALLLPLGGSSIQVAQNFGSAGAGESGVDGVSGTYGLYADAYREAAKERGVLPRQMQSVTWEAVRGLFSAVFKRTQTKAKSDIKRAVTNGKMTPEQGAKLLKRASDGSVSELWKDYKLGRISIDELRKTLINEAGGIQPPSWSGRTQNPANKSKADAIPNSGKNDPKQNAADAGAISGGVLPVGGSPRSPTGGTGSGPSSTIPDSVIGTNAKPPEGYQ